MTDQLTTSGPADGMAAPGESTKRRREPSIPSTLVEIDPLSAALLTWAGKHDPADTAAALRAELRTRGIETVAQFLGSNPSVIVTALQVALRQDAVSLINLVAQAKSEE